MIAHDIYAETNPAWVGYVLVAFLRGFVEAEPAGAELPLAYLGLPICLSGDLATTFEGSNKKTGLREWLERSPQIQLDLGQTQWVNESGHRSCPIGMLHQDGAP
jgi:hypothetical protein